MQRPPSIERLNEITNSYKNRVRSRMGTDSLWGIVGELIALLEFQNHPLAFLGTAASAAPEMVPSALVIEAKADLGTIRVAAVRTPERVLMAHACMAADRPQKPPTPSPGEWKGMTPEAQSDHFRATQAYEASLTPEEREAILAAESEIEAQHRAGYQQWKHAFDPDTPYQPPG